MPAMATRPADRHPFTLAPTLHTRTERVDAPGDLVTGRNRESQARGKLVFDEDRIGVADAAGIDGDPHGAGCRIGQCSIDKRELVSR